MNSALNSNVRTLRCSANASPAARRLRANWPAKIKIGPSRSPCMVTDVSAAGACLTFEDGADQNTPIWLVIDKLPPISAAIVWRRKNRVGVRFDEEQAWVHQTYQQRFDPAAWVRGTELAS